MADPRTVYQLALRIGVSYEAACLALRREDIIDTAALRHLQSVQPRTLKVELLNDFKVENYYPDVWLLTERDTDLTLEGQPDDLFVIKLNESAGAGYLWTTSGLVEAGFAILRDVRNIPPLAADTPIGGPVTRALTARRSEPAKGDFALELRRPWQKAGLPVARLHVMYDLFGKEVGIPRALRRQLRAA